MLILGIYIYIHINKFLHPCCSFKFVPTTDIYSNKKKKVPVVDLKKKNFLFLTTLEYIQDLFCEIGCLVKNCMILTF